MENTHQKQLTEFLKEAEAIASYLKRQVNTNVIRGQIDKQVIHKFLIALDDYRKVSGN